MDIGSLTSGYIESATNSARQATSKASAAAKKDYSNSTDEELLDACKQFEAYFIEQVLKEVQKTIPESSLTDGPTSSLVGYFKDETIQEIAGNIQDQQQLGLAQQMYEQLKRNYSNVIPTAKNDEAAEETEEAVAESLEETEEII